MNTVKVDKAKLLKTLKANRKEHKASYEKAVKGYRKAVIKELKKRLTDIEGGGKIDLIFHLPKPQSFVNEYDNAISLVKWSVEDEVELTDEYFKQYVLNEWYWRGSFLAGTQAYIS